MIVESEHDQTVPHQVIENYLAAFKAARSLRRHLIKGADRGSVGSVSKINSVIFGRAVRGGRC